LQRSYPDRPIVAVGALIIRDRQIVLVRRQQPPLAGEWSIPGGAVQLGETLHAALKREVREETGLLVEPVELACVLDRIMPDAKNVPEYHYILIDYVCRIAGGNLRAGSDVSDVRWANLDELEPLGVAEFTRDVIGQHLH
jgi:ADP-ribose pyrophosphatase YjhB (NUDIX family)